MSAAARLTAFGFAFGSAAHATGWTLLWWGINLYGPGYPAWRHAAFAVIDALIVWVAVQRPAWLVFPLAAFLAEQIWDHGVEPGRRACDACGPRCWLGPLANPKGSTPERLAWSVPHS